MWWQWAIAIHATRWARQGKARGACQSCLRKSQVESRDLDCHLRCGEVEVGRYVIRRQEKRRDRYCVRVAGSLCDKIWMHSLTPSLHARAHGRTLVTFVRKQCESLSWWAVLYLPCVRALACYLHCIALRCFEGMEVMCGEYESDAWRIWEWSTERWERREK